MLKHLAFAVATSASIIVFAGHVSAANSVNLGMLVCDMSKGIGFVLVEKQKMTCEFRPISGPTEQYTGKITDFGIELGEIKEGHLIWGVFAAALLDMQPGALAGNYLGVDADAALGLGVGANAIVGGTRSRWKAKSASTSPPASALSRSKPSTDRTGSAAFLSTLPWSRRHPLDLRFLRTIQADRIFTQRRRADLSDHCGAAGETDL
jgi:hypothetical protein